MVEPVTTRLPGVAHRSGPYYTVPPLASATGAAPVGAGSDAGSAFLRPVVTRPPWAGAVPHLPAPFAPFGPPLPEPAPVPRATVAAVAVVALLLVAAVVVAMWALYGW
jgi:hypothetical protein